MMKKIFQILLIPTIYLIITSSSGGSTPAWQKENVSFPMMNIEINATMKDHNRQKERVEEEEDFSFDSDFSKEKVEPLKEFWD